MSPHAMLEDDEFAQEISLAADGTVACVKKQRATTFRHRLWRQARGSFGGSWSNFV